MLYQTKSMQSSKSFQIGFYFGVRVWLLTFLLSWKFQKEIILSILLFHYQWNRLLKLLVSVCDW